MKNEEYFLENLVVPAPKWPVTKLAAPKVAARKLQRRKVLFPMVVNWGSF